MKQGWEIKKLDDICFINIGKTPSRSNPNLWDKNKTTKNIWLSIADLNNIQNGIVTDSKEYVSYNAIPLLKKVEAGTLLLSFKLTIGRTAYAGCDLYTNEAIAALPFKKKLISKELLKYFFDFFDWERLTRGDIKVKGKTLNKEKMKHIPIIIPHISEQEQIVRVLDSAFAKIEALRANARQNLKNAKDLFLSSVENEFTIRDGWKNIKLNSIADVTSGYAFKSGEFLDKGKFQVIRIGNVKQDFLRLAESPIFIESIDQNILSKSLLQRGDLVITQTGTKKKRDYGFVALINSDNLLLNQRVACVRFKDKDINPKYFLYYSYTEKYKNDFFAQEGGAVGQGNVGLGTIKELNVPFPSSSDEQIYIIEKLDALNDRCRTMEENYRQTIAHCNTLKQALLTKAFNGNL